MNSININSMVVSAVGLGLGLSAAASMQLNIPRNLFSIGCLCFAGQVLTHGLSLIADSIAERCAKSVRDSFSAYRRTQAPNLRTTELYLAFNRLTHAPDLSQYPELTELYLAFNRLTHAPDVSQNQKLTKIDLAGNRLTQPLDVSQNRNLERLELNQNQLTQAPDVSQNPELISLDLSNNQLTRAPDVSRNRNLRVLCLFNNRLSSLHDSIFCLPRSCRVRTNGNLFTPAYAQLIRDRIANIRRENPNLGPDIEFGVHDAAAAVAAVRGRTNFETEIHSWLSQDQEERKSHTPVDVSLQKILSDEHKELLSRYLAALKHTADYKNGVSKRALINRVNNILQLASEKKEFRENILSILVDRQRNPTCGDGVMVQLNDIEVQWHIFHKEHGLEEFKELAASVQRHEDLKSHAKKMAGIHGWGDEAEIILGYQIELKDRLSLPISTQGMLYPRLAGGITSKMLNDAVNEINIPQIDLLARSDLWRNYLKKDRLNKEKFDDLENRFGGLMEQLEGRDMRTADYLAQVNEIRQSREQALCALTKELSEKRVY